MNFNFFEQLSKQDADNYLSQFLFNEKIGFNSLFETFDSKNIKIDYTFNSLIAVLECINSFLKIIPEPIDESLPDWIKNTDEYLSNLFSFDDDSKILILRASYYFGECFIKENNQLCWSIGKKTSPYYNMPTIRGFKNKLELPPIVVCENMFSTTVHGDISVISSTIDAWRNLM